MRKQITGLALAAVLLQTTFSLDVAKVERDMEALSSKVEQSLISLQKAGNLQGSAELERMMPNNDRNKASLKDQVNSATNLSELSGIESILNQYSNGSSAQKYVASMVQRMVKKKMVFLKINDMGDGVNDASIPESISTKVRVDTFLRPDEFIETEVGAIEGTVSLSDDGDKDRVAHFQGILERHECDLLSQYINTDGDDHYNFYFSCKDFVSKALVDHYKGVSGGQFDVSMELKSGGWLFGSEANFDFKPEAKEQGSLGWVRSVLEQNPFEYLYRNKLMDMNQLGKIKEIAGEETLMVKNARFKMWVTPKGATRSEAIYFAEHKLGDLSLRGGQR